MWMLIPPIVHSHPSLTDTAKHLYGIVLFEAGMAGACLYSDGEFAELLGVSEPTIEKHMKTLEEMGLLAVHWVVERREIEPNFARSNNSGTELAFSTSSKINEAPVTSVDVHEQQQLQKSVFTDRKYTQKELNEEALVENRPSSPIRKVFDYWSDRRKETLQACGVRGRDQKLTGKRRRRIASRLKDGRTVEEIEAAIDGCMASEYHVAHRYLDIELICRDDEHLTRFILLHDKLAREQAIGPKLRVLN